jgi:hypothetical protein
MASRAEREGAKLERDEQDRAAAGRGHKLAWQLGENANKAGHAYFFEGTCEHCGAVVMVGSAWTSSHGVLDARDALCSGPGTAVLAEIEAGRRAELFAEAVAQFGRDVAAALGAEPEMCAACEQWPARHGEVCCLCNEQGSCVVDQLEEEIG